jgi:hypothetical protein
VRQASRPPHPLDWKYVAKVCDSRRCVDSGELHGFWIAQATAAEATHRTDAGCPNITCARPRDSPDARPHSGSLPCRRVVRRCCIPPAARPWATSLQPASSPLLLYRPAPPAYVTTKLRDGLAQKQEIGSRMKCNSNHHCCSHLICRPRSSTLVVTRGRRALPPSLSDAKRRR